MRSGQYPKEIYAILYNPTKKMYIGMSKKPMTRYMHHVSLLRKGKHPVEDFQHDFDTHGEDFSFFVFDRVESIDQRHKEMIWIKKYKTYDREHGYNYKDPGIFRRKTRELIPLKDGLPPAIEESTL